MAINLSDSIRVGQQKPVDDKYYNQLVPYVSVAEANSLLLISIRYKGLTVNINNVEYWYESGINDINLVEKKSGLTSVGLTMPAAFAVANSPLIANGTLAVTALGVSSQYIRGDGQLATLPTFSGGGSSVNYYLNGSVPASVIGYEQLSTTPVLGIGTDYTLSTDGLIAQFLTDVGDPDRILIPAGGWIFEMFFSVASATPTCKFYVELLKYDGLTFTSIANSSAVPEALSGGSIIDLYTTSLAVPEYTLLVTDRLVIRVYIVDNIPSSSLVTLHTENSHLCEIITTFSTGLSSLNGLTDNTQYLAVGTLGSDFYISSVGDTHTFNLPTASPLSRGALSSTDWGIFNSKQSALTFDTTPTALSINPVTSGGVYQEFTNYLKLTGGTLTGNLSTTVGGSSYLRTDILKLYDIPVGTDVNITYSDGVLSVSSEGVLSQSASFDFGGLSIPRNYTLPDNSGTLALTSDIPSLSGYVTGTGTINTLPKFTGASAIGDSNISDSGSLVTITGDSLFNGNITISQPAALRFVQENAIVVPPVGQSAIDAVSQTLTFIATTTGLNYKGFALDVSGSTVNSLWYYTMPNANGTLALVSDIHDAITIGTANGLSLIGQQLSLGLSSGSSNGALSSTDWTTFNTKQSTISFSAIGAVPNSSGASISGGVITMQPANVSFGGVVTTGSQQFSGAKTFLTSGNTFIGQTVFTSAGQVYISSGSNRHFRINTPSQIDWVISNANGVAYSTAGALTFFRDETEYLNILPNGTVNYAVDRSLSYTSRSLVDKAYADTKQSALTNPITGTGTTNKLPKFTGTTTLGDSQIFDNGTNVGINTTTPTEKLHVVGNGLFSGNVTATTFVGNLNGTANDTINWVGYGIYNDDPSYVDGSITEPYLLFGYYPDGYFRSFDYTQVQSFVGINNGSTLTNNISGNAATATNASQLNGQIASYYTDIPARLGYTPVNQTRLINTTSPLLGGGDLSADKTLSIQQATSLQNGYLSSTDWNTFNNKSTIPALTSGSVLFSNGTTITQNNANFFWDNTNKRLGIGTITPATFLNIYTSNSNIAKTEMLRMEVKNSASAVLDYFKFTLGATSARGGSIIFGESGGGFPEAGIDFNLNHVQIYQGGAYPIYLRTNNTNRVTVTGTGTVLMNQTTDDLVNKLQLTGNAKITATSAIVSSTLLTLFSGSTFAATQDANTGYSLNFDAIGYNPGNYFTRTGAQIQMLKVGSWNREVTGTNYASLVFSLNNSATNTLIERMRLSYTGNLLLGSAVDDLTNKLQVTGGSIVVKNSGVPALNLYRDLDVTVVGAAGQGMQFGARSGSTFIAGAAIYGSLGNPATTGSLVFQTLNGISLETRLIIASTGNVGIGTTSPVSALSFADTAGTAGEVSKISLFSTSGSGLYGFGVSPNQLDYVSGGSHVFYNRASGVSTERMRITSSGNVGIGTTAPSYPLHVATEVSNISIYADYDIVAFSDQSVKENIRPIDNVLNRVVKSRGVLYDRIDSGSKNNIGFIAQELEIEFPELVVENPDGTKAVKYQNAVAVLFEAIKEQQKQIEELKLLIG